MRTWPRWIRVALLALVVVVGAGRVVIAQGTPSPIVPDRPDFTNGAQIIPLGSIQIEAGIGLARDGSSHTFDAGELNIRVPVSSVVEIDLQPGGWQRPGSGPSGSQDAAIACKAKLFDGGASRGDFGTLDLGLLAGTLLPTGSRAVAERAMQPFATFAADVALADSVGLSVNLGASRGREAGERFTQVFGGCSLGIEIGDGVDLFIEGFAWDPDGHGGTVRRIVDVGVHVPLGDVVLLDVKIGADPADPAARQFAGAGLTLRL